MRSCSAFQASLPTVDMSGHSPLFASLQAARLSLWGRVGCSRRSSGPRLFWCWTGHAITSAIRASASSRLSATSANSTEATAGLMPLACTRSSIASLASERTV